MNDLAKMYNDLLQQGVPAPEIPATIARIASQAAQYKQRLLANGYPQSYVDGLSSQELFNLGQSGALPLTTGSADLNREAEGRRDAETALGNRSGAALSLAAILAQEARDKASAQNDTFRLPEALANLSGVSGSASPLQTLIGEGKYIDAQYTPDPMLEELKKRLMGYANPVPPSATDARVYAAYDEDPIRAEKFFGRPDPRGNASGGYQRLNKPVTVFDISGKPVATGAENGPEMMRVDRGGVRFKPLPGVSRQLPSWRPGQIARQTMGNMRPESPTSGPVDMSMPTMRNTPPPSAVVGPVDTSMPPMRTMTPPSGEVGPVDMSPPVHTGMFGNRMADAVNRIYGAQRGDANYRPGYDFNQDGLIDLTDIQAAYDLSRGFANLRGHAAGGGLRFSRDFGTELQRSIREANPAARRAAAERETTTWANVGPPGSAERRRQQDLNAADNDEKLQALGRQQARRNPNPIDPATGLGIYNRSGAGDTANPAFSSQPTGANPGTSGSSGAVSLRAATAIALGKALRGNPFAHPDMVAALLSGNPPPPGSITQRFRNNVDPVILETLMNSVMPAFGFRGADVTAEARRFDPQGLSYAQVSR